MRGSVSEPHSVLRDHRPRGHGVRRFKGSHALSVLPLTSCYGGRMNAIEIVKESVPVPSQLRVEDIDQQEHVVVVRVSSTQAPRCPTCTSVRVSYHSRYDRRLRDLPWQGRQVQLCLRTRRFRCRNGACRRKIFAECLPGVRAGIKPVIGGGRSGRLCLGRLAGRPSVGAPRHCQQCRQLIYGRYLAAATNRG
jgi:hypothetical protein